MSDVLMSGQRFRTFNVLDDFNREALAIEVDTTLPAARVVRVLDRVVAWRGCPAKHSVGVAALGDEVIPKQLNSLLALAFSGEDHRTVLTIEVNEDGHVETAAQVP